MADQAGNTLNEHPIAGGIPGAPTSPLPVTPPVLPGQPSAAVPPASGPTPPIASPPPPPSVTPAVPVVDRKELEARAKKIISDLNAAAKTKSSGIGEEPKLPKRSPKVAALIVALMVLVGGGGFAGYTLLNREQSAEIGSQAACSINSPKCSEVSCAPRDATVCKGEWFVVDCLAGWTCGKVTCQGTKDCSTTGEHPSPTPRPTTPPTTPWCSDPGDKCTIGAHECQHNAQGQNTGYYCTCVDQSHVEGGVYCMKTVWSCPNINSDQCPGGTGNDDGVISAACSTGNIEWTDASKRCVKSSIKGQTISAAKFTCPNVFTPLYPNGCTDNREDINGVTSVCFDNSFCGSQQIDVAVTNCTTGHCCTASVVDYFCETQPPKPSATPTTPSLACTTLGFSNNNPVYGQTVTLTCTGTPNASVGYAYYQYSVNGGAYINLTNTTNTTAQLTISKTGTYSVRCRVCKSQDQTTCTTWQTAGTQ